MITRSKTIDIATVALVSIFLAICLTTAPAIAQDDNWISDSAIVSGLGDIGGASAPTVFCKDGTWYLIAGEDSGWFNGFKWNGSAWESDSAIVSGLEREPGSGWLYTHPTVFNMDGTWYLISGNHYGDFYGFYWHSKRSRWLPDSDIVSGLGDVGEKSAPDVFNKDGTWYLISGVNAWSETERFYGVVYGFKWNGSAWQSIPAIVSGLGHLGSGKAAPDVFNQGGTWYLISGETEGIFNGYRWTGSEWESVPAIVSGLSDVGGVSAPEIFYMNERWYLISGESYGRFYGFSQNPDLTPTAITVPKLFVNQSSTINATIANIGTADAGSFNMSLSVNGSVVNTAKVPSLSAGNSTNVSFVWTPASGGELELCVVADPGNAIVEMDETNNKKCIPVTVNAPDLALTAMTAPTLLFVNQQGTINATIANIGVLDAPAFNVSLVANGSVIGTANVPLLNAGNSTNVNFEWTPASGGDHDLCVVADAENAIAELDETNNELCSVVTVENIKWQYAAGMPWDVERLSNGNTLITEFGNHTVIVVTPITLTKEIIYGNGTAGSGENQLNSPIDAERLLDSGNTLITDSKNHRVIEVDTGGNIIWQYGNGTPGDGINQLNFPMDAERLANGNTLITDEHNCRVIELRTSDYDTTKPDNNFSAYSIVWQYGTTGVSGSGPNELNYPKDADRLPNNNTLIADYRNHRVIEVTSGKDVVWQYGTGSPDEPGSGPNELNNPTDAERLPDNNTLIADNSNHRVIEVTQAKKIIGQYGTSEVAGSGENELNRPADAERLSNGNTLIADTINSRIIEVIALPPPPPVIVSYAPPSPVYDAVGAERTFNITTDQTVDVDWQLNGVVVKSDAGVTESSYTNASAKEGTWTVSAIASNANGTDMQQWDWMVVSALGPDLIVSRIDAYHNKTLYPRELYPPYFNLSNEVDVTVTNIGTEPAAGSSVSLSVGDEFIGKLPVPSIDLGNSTTVQFKWTPIGCDCEDDGIPRTYTLKAVADCDDDVVEGDEGNNESTAQETAYWAGYSADEELVEASHGVIRGGLLYTTGDGRYVGLYEHGSYRDTHYNIELPADATVKHARLNVYYTWSRTKVYPVMEVSITNDATGESHTFTSPAASYNDRPCPSPAISFEYPWGNYVYNLTAYITDSGSYTVRVKNNGSAEDPSNFAIAAPGLVIVYEDSSMPEYEYWILEGADVVEGGRRGGAGYLSLEECTNDAVFPRSIDLSKVSSATLGMVSIWGGAAWGEWTSYYWFNDNYLGEGGNTLFGYTSLYNETIGGMSMYVGASGNAQVGANVSDVTDYIVSNGNVVTFGDDGDSMMPSNAFLLVERGRAEKPEPAVLVPFMVSGFATDINGTAVDNPSVTIKNMNTGEPLPSAKTHNDYSYYEVLASLANASCGDVLWVTCGEISTEHRVRQSEIDAGGFELNVTCLVTEVPPTPKPDLTVTEKNETLLEDGNFTVTYTVANIGSVEAGASNTTIYIDGVNVLEDTVPALAAGASYTNTVGPFECPCNQTLNVTVCADNGDAVDESDETNNCLSNEWVCPACEFIEAGVRIEPETLNLNSSGVFTAFITLPGEYDVKDINVSTVKCEGAPLVNRSTNIIQGINTLNAKFNVSDLRENLPTGDNVTMTVTGKMLTTGETFEGNDTIRVNK